MHTCIIYTLLDELTPPYAGELGIHAPQPRPLHTPRPRHRCVSILCSPVHRLFHPAERHGPLRVPPARPPLCSCHSVATIVPEPVRQTHLAPFSAWSGCKPMPGSASGPVKIQHRRLPNLGRPNRGGWCGACSTARCGPLPSPRPIY